MKRLVALGCLLLALAAGAARAATFSVVPSGSALPTASAANLAGGLALGSYWRIAPVRPQQLSSSGLLSVWQGAGNAYGIPWQVLAAINKIESNFGRNMGPSSAGAIGWMQFMPSTWVRWGVDADGNGLADPWAPADAIYAASRYLAAAGGGADLSRAIFAYNHAQWYVDEVLRLARAYGLGGDPQGASHVVFSLDRLQTGLASAGQAVSRANAHYIPARAKERALAKSLRRLQRREAHARLLSDRLELRQRAVQLAVRLGAVHAKIARLRSRLHTAHAKLSSLTQKAGASSFDRTVAGVVAAPVYSGGYAFPVGGGPDVVSVGHTHHDYPAADIAAPEGSPVYALADSVVLKSWSAPDARCGIGLTLETKDGRSWTYCHLSFLDPDMRPGASLSAGIPVGLVGSTGDATGPHLHLQLTPATSYPQVESWFQSFAGSAFRWQDGRVFAIVGD
jgi:murein DD-endopeptidase MepM/ murein hydrolase activator NlpD